MTLTTRSICLTLLLVSSPTWADPTPKSDAAAQPVPVETTPASTAETTATTAVEPTTMLTTVPAGPASRYPRAVIARPLTLPRGIAVAGADVVADSDLETLTGNPIAGYGITDDLEVLLLYGFSAKDLEARGSLNLDAGYQVLRGAAGGKLEAIARVRGGYDVLDEVANPLLVGLHVQYNITDWLAVISGVPGTQQLRIALEETADGRRPIDLSLPIGIGVQAAPRLYLQLDTQLAQIDLRDSETAFVGVDTTPVALTAVYNALPALDILAAIGTDLSSSPGDALTFLIGARYYAGDL